MSKKKDRWILSDKDFKDVSDEAQFLMDKLRAHEITEEEYLHWGGTENPHETSMFGFDSTTKAQHALFERMKTWHLERMKLIEVRALEAQKNEVNYEVCREIEKKRADFLKKHNIRSEADLRAMIHSTEYLELETRYNVASKQIETSEELIARWTSQIDQSFEHAEEYRRRGAREELARVDRELTRSSDFLGKSFKKEVQHEQRAQVAEIQTRAISAMKTQARPYRRETTTDFMTMMLAGLQTAPAKKLPSTLKFAS